MPYNFAADSFQTKKLCMQTFFKRSAILEEKKPFCVCKISDRRGRLPQMT